MEEGLRLKVGLAEMLKGGVIMDVVTIDHAKIAEDAGAAAVMALERVPADIRREGGVARMSDPALIEEIMKGVSIPVMAKCRIGHFAEAQILQEMGVDYIDESEVLTPADDAHHVDKHAFKTPFVCGATNLGEALRRIGEGACMIRTKGEAGTGDIIEAVKHLRSIKRDMLLIQQLSEMELMSEAKRLGAPYELIRMVHKAGKLPVPMFTAGGIATPADASLLMQLGAEAVFVGSGIFKAGEGMPAEKQRAEWAKRANAIVKATTNFDKPDELLKVQRGLGKAMSGIARNMLPEEQKLAARGVVAMRGESLRIGILGLQGAVAPHRDKLLALGQQPVLVRNAQELSGCRGLIIPGGESTTMLKLIHDYRLKPALLEFAAAHSVWGVCAGSILIAAEVENPSQESFGLLPIAVRRNAYGRQNESFIAQVDVTLPGQPPTRQEAVFIRAPQFTRVPESVTVLARHNGQPVALSQGRHMVTAFHPELSVPDRLHRFFLGLCESATALKSA